MFKKICSFTILSFAVISSFLVAEIEYDIQDIGTLQTHSSQAIALNNQGQILGWYSIDGSENGKHFFVRNRGGVFYELPEHEPASGLVINWQYLTDDGKAYGTFDVNAATRALCVWDQQNGIVKLGVLPGKEIAAINNAGQVLIQSIIENENGKSIRRPVIWKNGQITKLNGLGGDLGIESEESYGYGLNNKGEVVGQSLVSLSYKNELYKQVHAVKWINGNKIDLHNEFAKTPNSYAVALNDAGDVIIQSDIWGLLCLDKDGNHIANHGEIHNYNKINNRYMYGNGYVYDFHKKTVSNIVRLDNKVMNDNHSIWSRIYTEIVKVNDNGEIITHGKTIYGEEHAILLTPLNP